MPATGADHDRPGSEPLAGPEWPDLEDRSAEDDLPVKIGETLAERYMIEGILGTGGMGIVCRARHVELEQPVAVKFLRMRFAEQRSVVARFLEEARAAAALRSIHAVRVMDVGQTPRGVPFYVMEHLEGTDLESLLVREGPLRVPRALDYVRQACAALREAHALGIVHRDVKPENLFLSTRGKETPVLKVVDFGIAKRLDPARAKVVTGPQENLGSPCYMSPEQMWTPRSIDTRTDVWSLGVVLYQLLTGALPFDGDSVSDVFALVASGEFTPMSALRPDIDSHLDAIVGRCLEKSLDARYPSVDALARDIEEYEQSVLSGIGPSPRFGAPPARMRSDAPVARVVHPSAAPRARSVAGGFVALSLAGLLGLVAVRRGPLALEVAVTRASHEVTRAAHAAQERLVPARLVVTPDEQERPRANEPVVYVVEPLGAVVSDAAYGTEVRAERERNGSAEDGRAEDEGTAQAAPKAATPSSTPAQQRERSYRRYLARHGWRPLKEVLEEMNRPE